MKRKVLFVASTFSHIRNFHLPYLKAFQELGYEVHIACGGEREDLPFVDRSFVLPFEKQLFSIQNLLAAKTLRKMIKQESYILICTHATLASFCTRLAVKAMCNRPKILYMCHGYLFDDTTSPLKKTIYLCAEKLTVRQTDLLLTMNEYDYDLAKRKHLGLRIEYIPGVGVDYRRLDETNIKSDQELRKSLNISPDSFVLFYAAELSSRKSQQTLIKIMPSLSENTVLILAGAGVKREEYMQLAESLGVSNRVLFPGHITSIGSWYNLADVVVSSSRSEGLPFNIMEAMHFGKPIVASNVKGNSDLIKDGVNGLLFPYNDSQTCIRAVNKLINDPALRLSLGKQAASDSCQYSIENVFSIVWDKYLSLINL